MKRRMCTLSYLSYLCAFIFDHLVQIEIKLMLFVTPVSGPLVFAVLEIPFHPLSTVMSGVRKKQGAICAPQGAGITAGKRDHLRGCHVWQDVRSALVQAPQSEHGLRAS